MERLEKMCYYNVKVIALQVGNLVKQRRMCVKQYTLQNFFNKKQPSIFNFQCIFPVDFFLLFV